jgi:hypothetical protein
VRVRVRRQFARRAVLLARGVARRSRSSLPLCALALSPGRATSLALVARAGSSGSSRWSPPSSSASWSPLKRFGSDDAMARWIGARHRPVASDLLSTDRAGSLRRRRRARPLAGVLIEALTDGTARRLEGRDRGPVFGRSSPRAARRARARRERAAVARGGDCRRRGACRTAGARSWSPPAKPWNGATLSSMPLVGDMTDHPDAAGLQPAAQPTSTPSTGRLPGAGRHLA